MQGTVLLAGAAIVSKLLGTLQKIPLQNMAGDGAFGIYNAVYPLYILILFLATAGFPITVSKFVSERAAVGDFQGAKRIVKISSLLLFGSGLVFFLLLYFGADKLAAWIGISQTERAIRSVSFALLLTPVMAVLRGYFQGYQNMKPTAVSQVLEQLVRVITMVALLLYFVSFEYSLDWIAAGATFGAVTGAAAGLAVMLFYWRRGALERKKERATLEKAAVGTIQGVSTWRLVKQITAYAIPICLGTIAVPILTLVDTFTMPRLLAVSPFSEAEAMRQFGLYNRGLPLVQLVAMIVSAMSVALVPAIAEAKAKGQTALIRSRTELSVRLTWMVGLAASFGLAFAAVPINIMLYKTDEASWAMAIIAFTALFSALNTVSGSVLQGIGAVRTPALSLLLAIVLKALGNVLLMPRWGIEGAALSAVIAFAAAAGLTLVQAARCTGARFALRQYAAGPTLAVGLMGGCLAALQLGAKAVPAWLLPPERWAYSAIALLCVAGGAACYVVVLLRSGSISREDLRLFPQLDRKVTPILTKYKLLPKARE
ncbi:putative polysaccharide biosynthesis protein [Paenibacillus eucommiae]|uniref:O-antigen/teichoic acid export membrane protein n=1 Tax=Paenibacillus eucommiae TaxID=1355755 RepID=A0ABS4J8K8_9BACL|nr:oligosaccharide flippase family protein [Paenibacillus eucommiae]MBP1996170.1 O-antigen/teichoic acid export membrane protein [Paenibacillus eucommiae]